MFCVCVFSYSKCHRNGDLRVLLSKNVSPLIQKGFRKNCYTFVVRLDVKVVFL